jgi:inositol-pentakisphosphate 2-kinase
MHSHLRAHKAQQVVTNYCPLDLFSGDERRIAKAINALWDAWVASDASMNNLKIFAGGKFVTPSDVSLVVGALNFSIDQFVVTSPIYYWQRVTTMDKS